MKQVLYELRRSLPLAKDKFSEKKQQQKRQKTHKETHALAYNHAKNLVKELAIDISHLDIRRSRSTSTSSTAIPRPDSKLSDNDNADQAAHIQ